MSEGVLSNAVCETPIAIIDFETTGLAPGPDRVVEVSVVRIDPGQQPRIILDTLVNPDRPMAATEIHGITDRDVEDAPRFFDVGGDFLRAISGCVVASYNVYFDIGFLTYELLRMGQKGVPPHLCLMYLRPLLELGKRCSLAEACGAFGISIPLAHQSSADALACAKLWDRYLTSMQSAGLKTFDDLAKRKQYKFFASMESRPLKAPEEDVLPPLAKPKSRYATMAEPTPELPPGPKYDLQAELERLDQRQSALHRYWDELTTVIRDLDITREELATIRRVRTEMGLSDEEVRGMHARIFLNYLSRGMDDKVIDAGEMATISRLYAALGKLGWAPGQGRMGR